MPLPHSHTADPNSSRAQQAELSPTTGVASNAIGALTQHQHALACTWLHQSRQLWQMATDSKFGYGSRQDPL